MSTFRTTHSGEVSQCTLASRSYYLHDYRHPLCALVLRLPISHTSRFSTLAGRYGCHQAPYERLRCGVYRPHHPDCAQRVGCQLSANCFILLILISRYFTFTAIATYVISVLDTRWASTHYQGVQLRKMDPWESL